MSLPHPSRSTLAACGALALLLLARSAGSEPAYPAAPMPVAANDHAPDIEAAILAITRESLFKEAAIGIAVLDIDSGHYLAVSHEHDPLNPASNAKLYTAACALATLHGDHRYETTLSGRIKGSVVAGPLVLRGYGDPVAPLGRPVGARAGAERARGYGRSRGTSSSISASSTSRPPPPPSSSSRTSGRLVPRAGERRLGEREHADDDRAPDERGEPGDRDVRPARVRGRRRERPVGGRGRARTPWGSRSRGARSG